MGVLTVFLDRVENLKDSDGIIAGKTDPYVKFNLEQDNLVFDKGYGKKQSSKKKNECNPVFGESFEFSDVPNDLNNMVLWVQIKDDDIGIDDNIGDCKIKLEGMDLSSEPKDVDKIVDRKGLGLLRKHARIYLKLSFTED